jgi:hypothetical protein
MPEDAVTITHAEALRLIDEQVGERVYLALFVTRAESESGEEGPIPFIHMSGRLGNPFPERPPRLEPDVGYYGFGREAFAAFPFPPLVGTTQLRDNGIDFLISDTAWIRIAWRDSKEVGNSHPDAGEQRRLKAMGVAGALSKDDPFLKRFLAKAERAPAKILEASPTEHTVGSGEAKRRVWALRVRVEPDGGAAFETEVERGWRLESEIEERIERGESLSGVPASPVELEVVYDPTDHEQAIVHPDDEAGDERTIEFRGMIVGRDVPL